MKPELRLALSEISAQRAAWIQALFWRALFRLMPLQLPLLTGVLIDSLNGREASWLPQAWTLDGISAVGMVLLGLSTLTGLFAYASQRANAELHGELTRALQLRVMHAWLHGPAELERRFGTSGLFDRTLNETRGIGTLGKLSAEAFAAALRVLYPAIMMCLQAPLLAMIPFAAIGMQTLVSHLLQRGQEDRSDRLREGKAQRIRHLKEHLDGLETVQSLNAQRWFLERMERDRASLKELSRQSGQRAAMQTASAWIFAMGTLATCWWMGSIRVASGEMSVGELVTFAGFAAYLALPMRTFARLLKTGRAALQQLRRVRQLLDAADGGAPAKPEGTPVPGGALEMRSVYYRSRKTTLLREMSVTFSPGELVWIRGASGSGKSTLLRLLCGLVAPSQGSIWLGGRDLRACCPRSLRETVALVPQRPPLFSATFADNLLMAKPQATLDELLRACRGAGLGALVERLPQGLATKMGEGGEQISGGELQRLAVARALLREPSVLLLDEPLAALDARAEAALMDTLCTLRGRVTVLLVSHSLRSLSAVDRIVELNNGQLRECWHHAGSPASTAGAL